MSTNRNRKKHSTRHSLVACFFLLLLASFLSGIPLARPQGAQAAQDTPPAFSVTFAKLGYADRALASPYSTTEYSLRLPEGWKLRAGSLVELDYSYTYTRVGALETKAIPSLFGEIIVTIDEQTPQVFPVKEATLEHSRLRVELPIATFNDPARRTHNIKVTLDASSLCSVPHKARLTVHSASLFSLNYDQLAIVADLALYPRPFYQRAFEPDQIRFVLPTQLTETDLNGAVAVATKLGNLAYRMVISGTTDQELLERLDVRDNISHEHLIVIGKPETNGVIQRLNNLGALPLPLRERQLSLSSEGPLAVVSGDSLTYTLMLTNTTQKAVSDLVLADTLPSGFQMESCSPTCSQTTLGEVRWAVPPLAADEASSFTLVLRASEAASSALENTVTLFDASSNLLNTNTLTATISSTPSSENHSSFSQSRYLFVQGAQAVPENDGVVQELISPWDQTRAILVITGLSDQAVSKASRAMGLENYFPGMQGPWALVRDVRPLSDLQPKSPITDTTFADLGYEDSILRGYFGEANYYFNLPIGWSLTEEAYLDLRFSHSAQLLDSVSSVNVLFNDKPIAAMPLTDENALNGRLKVKLPASQARPGASNGISIRAELRPVDACTNSDMWLYVSSASLLHLDHQVQNVRVLDLGFYPHPFNQRPDLTDVMFALPAEPVVAEWEDALRLAAALGSASNGSAFFAPPVVLGNNWTKKKLEDYHFIAIGRPSRNSLLQQVNAQLPQPFLIHSDSIEQKIDQVTLRLAPDVSLGYIQLIVSPWNEARALLAITGTTDKGAKEAMDILLYQPGQLKGNLALMRNNQVKTIDTRGLTKAGAAAALVTAVPQMSPAPTGSVSPSSSAGSTPSAPASKASALGRPAWLVPLVGVTGLAILVILVIAFWQARRGRL